MQDWILGNNGRQSLTRWLVCMDDRWSEQCNNVIIFDAKAIQNNLTAELFALTVRWAPQTGFRWGRSVANFKWNHCTCAKILLQRSVLHTTVFTTSTVFLEPSVSGETSYILQASFNFVCSVCWIETGERRNAWWRKQDIGGHRCVIIHIFVENRETVDVYMAKELSLYGVRKPELCSRIDSIWLQCSGKQQLANSKGFIFRTSSSYFVERGIADITFERRYWAENRKA